MKSIGFILVQGLRFLALPVAIWQALGLLPVFSWLGQPDAVTGGMWMMAMIKGFVLLVCLTLFFGLRGVANRLRPSAPESGSSSEQGARGPGSDS